MKKYIIAFCRNGLANRMNTVISSMRLAARDGKKLLLYWPEDYAFKTPFRELFENEIEELTESRFAEIRKNPSAHPDYQIVDSWRLASFPEDNIPSGFSRVFPSETGKDIDFEFERIPAPVRSAILPFVTKLRPRKEIADEAESFASCFDRETVSVHIRTWADSPWRRGQLFDERKIIEAIKWIPAEKIFVASDSLDMISRLREKFGTRILYYPVPGHADRRALIDLILLSKNRVLYTSFLSTLSDLAWWWGGCKAKAVPLPARTWFFKIMHLAADDFIVCFFYRWRNLIPVRSVWTRLLHRLDRG